MEILKSQRKSSMSDDVGSAFPLYRSAPPLQVRLKDFEHFAVDRLRGLHVIFLSKDHFINTGHRRSS